VAGFAAPKDKDGAVPATGEHPEAASCLRTLTR
jgi:hypothetical protein